MDTQGEVAAGDRTHRRDRRPALAWDAGNGRREPIAVIDVGSNSVRLVVFEGLDRHPRVLFNEKVLCGLGRGVGEKGRLEEEAVARALATLRRFALLCREMEVHAIEAVATAAVREAENGEEFVAAVARETGIALGVLSGAREAELSALGVISAFPHGQGVMGDLGGGSLELARIGAGAVVSQLSLPIGSLRLRGAFGDEIAPVREVTRGALAPHARWRGAAAGGDFYLVGGAWRALARVMMAQERAVLPILHGFEVDAGRALELADLIARQEPASLAQIRGVPAARALVLPQAAAVLGELLDWLAPRRLVVSAYGLREGLIYAQLPRRLKRKDPLIAACQALARANRRFGMPPELLRQWIDPLFAPRGPIALATGESRLVGAAAILADVAWHAHPDFRAERATLEVLSGHFVGVNHRERAWLALVMNALYGGEEDTVFARRCRRLLKEEQAERAVLVGMALRLAQRLAAGTPGPLTETALAMEADRLVLTVRPAAASLVGEVVLRRLSRLAGRLGLSFLVRSAPDS
ncbi:MAG: Ppx/GppA family phosphatase [Alphaproteobacteria bacterium]|nr:MAG: Ppx/GppA family phosphatase [Alphaproteobacteria bacterium]